MVKKSSIDIKSILSEIERQEKAMSAPGYVSRADSSVYLEQLPKKSKKKKTIIHVNQHVIKSNHKNSETEPVFTVKNGKTNRYAFEVVINGPSKVVYSPEKPLSCGARAWIETYADVELIGEKS